MVILFVFLVIENTKNTKQENRELNIEKQYNENTTNSWKELTEESKKDIVKKEDKKDSIKKEDKEEIIFPSNRIESFSKAKTILEKDVYNNSKTFYCGCSFKGKDIDLKSCWYKNIKNKMLSRAKKIEWEHIVPAENFWKSFNEWKNWDPTCVDSKGKSFKGRKCAEKSNQTFRIMQADMYNLVPAIGEVNGLRSNYDMTNKLNTESYNFCSDVELYPEYNLFSPSNDTKWDIARIYFYMQSAYPNHISLTKKYIEMLKQWDIEDPISSEECSIYNKKKEIMWYSVYIWENTCKNI